MAIECRREDDEKKETTGTNLVAYLTNENKANVNNVVFVILIIRIENNAHAVVQMKARSATIRS